MWANLADDMCIRDVPSAIRRYIVILDGVKGVGAINAFLLRMHVVCANALAEPSEFVCVRSTPGLFVGPVFLELAVFEHCAGGSVQDWERQWGIVHEADIDGRGGSFGKERKAIVVCL